MTPQDIEAEIAKLREFLPDRSFDEESLRAELEEAAVEYVNFH